MMIRYKCYGMMWRLEKMDLLKAKTTIGGVAYAVYPNIWGGRLDLECCLLVVSMQLFEVK